MTDKKTGRVKESSRNVVSSSSEASDNESKNSPKKKLHMATRRPRSSRRSSIPSHVKHYVEHNYHDHLHDTFEAGLPPDIEPDKNKNDLKRRRGHRGGVAVPFPEKLYYMLSRMDHNDTPDISAWQPHGRCFTVHKPQEFVEKIMPKFFKQTKLTSFQRQLNLYGFSRLTAGPDRGGYYHELFIRGRVDLCRRMTRTRVKGNGSKAASSPSTEPNFYAMEPCREEDQQHDADIETSGDGLEIIPDTDTVKECDGDEDGIGLPMDLEPPEEMIPPLAQVESRYSMESPPTTPTLSPRDRSESMGGIPPQITISGSSSSLPIVSPLGPRTLVSPPSSPQLLCSLSITTSDAILLDEDIHSGDQMFFEGLPFHYLETKDVEDSLILVVNPC